MGCGWPERRILYSWSLSAAAVQTGQSRVQIVVRVKHRRRIMRRRAASLPTSNPIVLFYAAAPLGVLYVYYLPLVLPMFALDR